MRVKRVDDAEKYGSFERPCMSLSAE